MIELARFASAHPSRELQAVIMLDEADLYLLAIGKPASKQPLENALRRFRSHGIGIMLATQSPGDIDYRRRENIQTWLVGRVKEARAIEKLSLVLAPTVESSLKSSASMSPVSSVSSDQTH
jgi:DNA helicase HerA-like ATPase